MNVGAISRKVAAVLLAALIVGIGSLSGAKAERVPVRAAPHEGYGRIVFNWESPVQYTARISNGRLVVEFNRSIEPVLNGVTRALSGYVRDAMQGSDGRSISFGLKNVFNLRFFDMGTVVVVDLLDSRTAKISQPDKEAIVAGAAPLVGVRTGEHEGYSRIVFDWRRKVPYKVEEKGGQATITFQRPGRLNLTEIKSRPPKHILDISSDLSENALTVTLGVPQSSRIRHFLSGPKVVIDVMTPRQAPARETAAAPPSPAPMQEPAGTENKLAAQATPPARVEKSEEATAKPKPLIPDQPVTSPDGGKAKEKTPPAVASLAEEKTKGLAVEKAKGADEEKTKGSTAALQPAPPPMPVPAVEETDLGEVVVSVALKFDWDEPVAAAVFSRSGYLWVAFDQSKEFDFDALRKKGENVVRSISRVKSDRSTVLRMTTVSGVNPTIRRDGLSWILEFSKQPLSPKTLIEAKHQPNSPIGARLFLPVAEPGGVIKVTDPEVGDNLLIVPVIPLGHGTGWNYDYPQVRLLPTGQGLVINPKTDDLIVRPLRQGIELTSLSGLQISKLSEEMAAVTVLGPSESLSKIFHLEKWSHGSSGSYIENRQKMMLSVAQAQEADKERSRLELARFFFSNGYGAEALGVLRVILENRPQIENDPEFRALRGASKFLMGRYSQAQEDFNHDSLQNIDEAEFWRSAIDASTNKMSQAAPKLQLTSGVTHLYPRALKMKLGMLVLGSAIDVGNTQLASRFLESLNLLKPKRSEKSNLTFFSGRVDELSGDFDNAVLKWESVMNGMHRPSRAKAIRARAELLLKLNKMTRPEVIEQLERLRFAWRGDQFEFDLLRRLGRLYMAEGNYRDGLRTLRQAATHFREYEDAPKVTQEMANVFSKLYLSGAADSMTPVTAIALYEEFKELTPPGGKGDEMIRHLADRLVAVDLLDRATALLDNQVQFRLESVEKARVGARLALVHILNRKYDKALEILDLSETDGMSETLITQRRHLRARALFGVDQGNNALTLLTKDESLEADLLRAEIYWQDRNWPEAAKVLQRLVRSTNAQPGGSLNDKQSRFILNLATALTLSGNERLLNRLRNNFGESMEAGPYKDAFRLIATPQTEGLIDYRTIADRVSVVESFQTFMNSYQDRLKSKKLSAIN